MRSTLFLFALVLGVADSACSSPEQRSHSYVNEGILCHATADDAASESPELHVVFDECASYCAQVVEATCTVDKDGKVFRVEARATTTTSMDNRPCPAACKTVEANCGFQLPSDSDVQIEFAGVRFSSPELAATRCLRD